MEKQIKLPKGIYTKKPLLYTINLYLEDFDYSLSETDAEIIISFRSDLDESVISHFKKELNFNALRFEIADENRELRKVIISKALGSINVD